jgi:signal transduction histidine kinase
MKARPSWNVLLPFVFGIVVLGFVAVTSYSNWRLAALDRASLDIADNAAPSIERLAAARGELRRLQILLRGYLDRRESGVPADSQTIHESRRTMDRSIEEYLALPVFPGERELWGAILGSEDRLNEAVTLCMSEAERGDLRAAEALLRQDIATAAESLGVAITEVVEFNAAHSRDLARQIKQMRGRSTSMAFALDGACAVLTVAGAIALRRAMRAHAELEDRHMRLLEERASELEQFAGTVAHDILGPLGVVSFSLELAGRPVDEKTRAGHVNRGVAAIERVKRLVNDLLEFARAGAKPDPSARCHVASTIAALVEHLSAETTKARIELIAETDPASEVVCNAGVLMSLVGNLTRNAIKYIGDGAVRRIEISARERGSMVRIEVKDSGPGLPPGLEEHVFEPYVRGPGPAQPGIGLGLATVKRLAEAHHGTCGVRSVSGEGCTFWFELPKATG